MKFLKRIYNKIFGYSQEEALYKAIIDQIPNYYIFWKDTNSTYLGCNQVFANLAGLNSPEQIIGKKDSDLPWPKEDADTFVAEDKKVMETRKPKLNLEEPHTLSTGERIILLTTKIPLINKKNEVYGVLGMCCNVTQQRLGQKDIRETNLKLEHAYLEARHLHDSLMDYLPNYFIFWKDLDGKYIGCNKAFAKLAGQNDPANLVGKSDYDYWPQAESDAYVADDKSVMKSGKPKLNIEESQTTPWGEKIILSTSKVPLTDEKGHVYGLLGICADITHQKLTEQQLIEMNKKLEQASRAKSEFIRNVSHDIRTPLSGILQTSRAIYEAKIKEEEIPEYSFDIWQASLKLMNLFNQVIEITKSETYEIEDQTVKFDLHHLLQELEKTYKIVAKHKELDFQVECSEFVPRFLLGKHLRLHRILMNLLGNAFKFTDKGSVRLLVEKAPSSNEDNVILKFSVIDTGIGIPNDKQHIIFQPFEKLKPSYQNLYPGSGLGLSLVKDYITKMQGEIYVESKLDEGSRFICILSFKRPIIENADEIANVEYSIEELLLRPTLPPNNFLSTNNSKSINSKYEILLVEDDSLAQKMGKKILSSIPGYNVDIAVSGEMALQMSTKKEYDLIYMDIGLPGIDGVETTKQIRLQNRNQKAYIIALTAHADEEIAQQCFSAGMDKILQKPLSPEKAQSIQETLIKKDQSESISNTTEDIIDWALWLQRVGGDQEMVETTFHLLGDSFKNYQNDIERAINDKEINKLQAIAHKLKGALGYCGLSKLEKNIKIFEEAAKQGNMDELMISYSKVNQSLEEANKVYEDWIINHPKPQKDK